MAAPQQWNGQASRGELHAMIRRDLAPRFAELAQFHSTPDLKASPLYAELRDAIEAAVHSLDRGDFAPAAPPKRSFYRFAAWNIERGMQWARQIDEFRRQGHLRDTDVVFLTEVDSGMSRSGNVHVARAIAQELGYNYVFAPFYLCLSKGTGRERRIAGENELGLHGCAMLSRYPILAVRTVTLPNGTDKMAGNEQRIGDSRAILATIQLPDGPLTAVCKHLDMQASPKHRAAQMRVVLDAIPDGDRVVLGGDWNTNTYNTSSVSRVVRGFARRVLMGPDRVIRNHSLHPERLFEKDLFRLLESRGYDYRGANVLGERTALYDIGDPRDHLSLAEWLPSAGFKLAHWALRNHGGCCPMKLDWFATRGVRARNPVVLHETRRRGEEPLSDHDAICVDVLL